MMGTPNLLLLVLIGAGWCGVLVTCEFTFGTDASPFFCSEEGSLWCAGDANVGSNGVLNLAPDDRTKPQEYVQTAGMALVSSPIDMRGKLYGWKSFSTHFTFRIEPMYPLGPGDGLAFVMLGSKVKGCAGRNFGAFDCFGWQIVQTVAVEFDTYQNIDIGDMNANHVGVDFQSIRSNISRDALEGGISLAGGEVIHAWIDYSAVYEQLEVRIRLDGRKPRDPFLSYSVALSDIFSGPVYVGFAGSNGGCKCHSFYSILYWTFQTFWEFRPLQFLLAIISLVVLLFVLVIILLHCYRSVSFTNLPKENPLSDRLLPEDSPAISPREFSSRELQSYTDGFNHRIRETKSISIYKGTLRMRIGPLWSSWFGWKKFDVAVTAWTTTNSIEAAIEFESMICTLTSVQHGNITRFFGWCREGDKCFVVHEFMRGDLEYALFKSRQSLSWKDRVNVIFDICEALCYLRKRRILHRQVKPSNILLDGVSVAEQGHMVTKAKLNDFRLAEALGPGDKIFVDKSLADEWSAGLSFGGLAPEAVKDGIFSEESDVYAFGSVILQIVTGKRTEDTIPNSSHFLLCNWLVEKLENNCLEDAIDPKLRHPFRQDDAKALLKLGLQCLQPDRNERPSMLVIKKKVESLRLPHSLVS